MMRLLSRLVKLSCHEHADPDSWIPIVVQKFFFNKIQSYVVHFQQNAVNALVVAIFFKLRVFRRRDAVNVGYDLRILRVVQPFPNKRYGCRAFS